MESNSKWNLLKTVDAITITLGQFDNSFRLKHADIDLYFLGDKTVSKSARIESANLER